VSEEAKEIKETLTEDAQDVVEEQAASVRDAVSEAEESSALRQSILTAAGLAAGGYLASKIRTWL
ncbi:MAG: hypothetical protein ABEK75_07895, partial [Salinibacter sp.]